MGGTTARGFTNRETIYYAFRDQEPSFFTQADVDRFTENGTKAFPFLQWFMVSIYPGETDHWVLAKNRSNPSNLLKVHVFYNTGTMRRQDNVHVASGSAGVNFSKTAGEANYYVAVEVPAQDTVINFDDGDGTAAAASTVANPVFTTRTDGKIEIDCSTTDAEIIFRESTQNKWSAYDDSYLNFNMAPGKIFYAVAGKLGMKSSGQVSYTVGYKLAQPTITVNEYPGAKVLVLESPETAIIHGLDLKYTVNGGSVQTYDPAATTPPEVLTSDVIVAWASKTGGSWTNSDTATLTVS